MMKTDHPVGNRKIKWGVLGCAGIVGWGFLPGLKQSRQSELYALASRSRSKAEEWAGKHGAKVAYGSYEELLADPLVEAVYIPLPNSLHAEWTLRAAKAGKHILCEKPLAAGPAEARRMIRTCQQAGVLLFEAFMYRFHPRTRMTLDLVRQGKIGQVQHLRGSFSFLCQDSGNIRLNADLAGGAIMDVGCYCVNYARLMTGAEPLSATAVMHFRPETINHRHPVDVATFGLLEFPGGVLLQFSSRLDSAHDGQWMEIIGTEGKIRVNHPFNGGGDNPTLLLNNETLPAPSAQQYALEVDAFCTAILENKPVCDLTSDPLDAARNLAAIEALYRSALTGKRTKVKKIR